MGSKNEIVLVSSAHATPSHILPLGPYLYSLAFLTLASSVFK